jgi:dTDP-4-dehydrorhamnose 3,5-epimerase
MGNKIAKELKMKFKKIPTPISDLYIIEPTVFGDNRGFFMEAYNKKEFEEIGMNMEFVQDNH